jgi:acetyl-CoA C-acetyltransferase
VDLAVNAGRPLLLRQPLRPDAFQQVVLGCVNPAADEVNPARIAQLRLGLDEATPAYTVQRNCGSGMQALDEGRRLIMAGDADLVLAGGAEALSQTPLLWPRPAVQWFARLNGAKTPQQKLLALLGIRPSFFKPVVGLEKGLTDIVSDLNMGQTAEVVAYLFGVGREEADAYAAQSHQRLAAAQAQGRLGEIEPMFSPDGRVYDFDDGVRPDSTPESLAKLRPVFEKPYGKVTAGNSSQITDGACWLILASEAAVEQHKLEPMARIVDCTWAGVDPRIMGLGPVLSSASLMKRNGLAMQDVDLWELNEAFAAQVLGCVKALADATFCRDVLGWEAPVGAIDPARMNVDGGAISLGHPVGTSGARIVLHLARALKQTGGKVGIATQCIGGGQGGSMLLEAM